MTIITIDHVSHSYEGTQVLHDISFKVNSGGRLALLGASGSGKTTLLRLIAGLERPTSGRILYNDVPLSEVKPMTRHIGMVFQNYALIPHWKSERSIGFYLSLRRREDEVPERVRRVSAITGVGLDALLDRRPVNLSGGEKQQVAIARAFARDLEVLLLDEPFANLDAKLRSSARLELQRLLQEFPITTLLVTHDQAEAAAIGEGILLLREGHMEQFGEYERLREDPASLYVAQFIGHTPINLFAGQVLDRMWHGVHFGGVALPQPTPDHTRLTLAIRPEHMRVGSGVSARITEVQHLYGLRRQVAELERDGITWRIECDAAVPLRVNDMVQSEPDSAYALFFDSAGQRYA